MSSAILEDILASAGQDAAGSDVEIIGKDPIFTSTFKMGELGAAAIGAAALQAARLYENRTGIHQTVRVGVEAATAAMRSFRYLREVPEAPSGPQRIPSAFYRTRDERWIFVHRAAEHHFARQLKVLGLGGAPEEESIVAAIARWDAEDLETAIMDAGACAAMVRSHDEWMQHPQGQAIASLPLFTITKIGESDPIPSGSGDRPLGGIRVLDLTRVLAGPTTARTLAEQGAEVLRISSPVYPDFGAMPRDTGHGKRSTVLDLRTAEGSGALRRLIADADVFSQGYRPGAIANLGFGPGELAQLRPGIITVSISAFGSEGPWKGNRGFDSVVEAGNGIAHEAGDEERPALIPSSPLDYTTGYLAAFLVEVALERRAREGGSYHIELSLSQTGRYLDLLPRLDTTLAAAGVLELPQSTIDDLSMERDTPYGRLRYLKPTAQLPVTPAFWERPTVPVDHDLPVW